MLKKCLSVLLSIAILLGAYSALAVSVPAADADTADTGATSGTTGDCTWSVEGTTLTISGSGNMADNIKYPFDTPWKNLGITEVVIKDGVTGIGIYSFNKCKSISRVTIPDSVTSIGRGAFESCSSLTNITIPQSVTAIGDSTFSGCSSLTSVTIPDSVTSLGEFAFGYCEKLQTIDIPHSVFNIGPDAFTFTAWYDAKPDGLVYAGRVAYKMKGKCPENVELRDDTVGIASDAFRVCSTLKSITIPDSVCYIGPSAFMDCTSLKSVIVPDSVIEIGTQAFGYYYERYNGYKTISGFTIYGCSESAAEEYALENNIKFIIIADEDTFIQKHLDYIGEAGSNNTYHNHMDNYDLSKYVMEDYGDLQTTYSSWSALRGKLFDNPYYTVLADLILSEENSSGMKESFNLRVLSEYKSLIKQIVSLMSETGELKPYQIKDVKKMFENGDYSNDKLYKLCTDILNNKVSQEKLTGVFDAYKKTSAAAGILNKILKQGSDVVKSVRETIEYSSVLKAYEETTDEFKAVLSQTANSCRSTDSRLYRAIQDYLNEDYYDKMLDKILDEIRKNGISTAGMLLDGSIEGTVQSFLLNNMNLSGLAASAASGVLSFIQGAKIGYSIGTGVDNILFNTDSAADSYAAVIATVKTSSYLKSVVKSNEASLRGEHTLKNTVMFCEAYHMYKHIQLNIANRMIKYFSANQTSLINKICQSNGIAYEVQIYNWQVLKLSWMDASCHSGYVLKSALKNITIACPVDVTIKDSAEKTLIRTEGDRIVEQSSDTEAMICNGIKYITIPDDGYYITVTATDNGTMSYSVRHLDVIGDSSRTISFGNIPLSKGSDYTGVILFGSLYPKEVLALRTSGAAVESDAGEYTGDSAVAVDSVSLNKTTLSVKVGETSALSASVKPQTASNKLVTWYSEDPDIASVDEYGAVTAKSAGEAKIVCLSLGGTAQAVCTVSVKSGSGGDYLPGDVNNDGKVSIADYSKVNKHVCKVKFLSEEECRRADVNGDGKVTIADLSRINKHICKVRSLW